MATELTTVLETPTTVSFAYPHASEGVDAWLKQQIDSLQATDQVIWLTPGLRYDRLLWLPEDTQLLLVVHNLRTLLRPKLAPLFGRKRLMAIVRYVLTRQARARRKLLNRHPTLLVPTHSLASSAVKFGWPEEQLDVWPFACRNAAAGELIKSRVVIPGAVRSQQRDYDTLQTMILYVLPKLDRPVELIFLGRCEDQAFMSKWRALEAVHTELKLVFFEDTLSTDDYQGWISSAQLLILPLREQVVFGPFIENLGSTKVSGGVFDALFFGKAILLPAFYSTERLLKPKQVHHYKTAQDAGEQLLHLLSASDIITRHEDSSDELQEQMYLTLSRLFRE